jgi:hypothetical protein
MDVFAAQNRTGTATSITAHFMKSATHSGL